MQTFRFEIKEKGRVVLPAGLRDACGLGVGAQLVARPLGAGRFVVETDERVLERIWSGIPDEASAPAATDPSFDGDLASADGDLGSADAARWERLAVPADGDDGEEGDEGHDIDASQRRSAAMLDVLGL
jgi:bifunctional DNA-binding transcriptional regulator/antitoxin component of YhaV-PrlF toxin-antitoxin module